jgi:hypothetical protein
MLPLVVFALSLLLSTLILLDGIAYFTFPLLPFKSFLLAIYSKNVEKTPDIPNSHYRTLLIDPKTTESIIQIQDLILTDATSNNAPEPHFLIFTNFSLYVYIFVFAIAILNRNRILCTVKNTVLKSPLARNLEGLETDLETDLNFKALSFEWSTMGNSSTASLLSKSSRYLSLLFFPDGKDYVTILAPIPGMLKPENNVQDVLEVLDEVPIASGPTPVLAITELISPSQTFKPSLLVNQSQLSAKVLLADIIPEIKPEVLKTSYMEPEDDSRSLVFQQQAMFFT